MVWFLTDTVLRRAVRLSVRMDRERMAELRLDEY